jgi:hypothetical protein
LSEDHDKPDKRRPNICIFQIAACPVEYHSDASRLIVFKWVSESEAIADGKKSATKLHILMNWQKQGADWKLLSRAATKL